MGVDEWGNAITSAVSLVCFFGAVVLSFNRKRRRIALYLALAFNVLFFPIRLWFFQFELTVRGSLSVAYIVEVVVIQLVLGGIVPLIVSCFFRFRPVITGLLLAYVLSLLLQFFSYAYWTYGTKQNFNINLSHLDSFYFAFGTLTTAGTGTISAISETSRGYQTLQMTLDLILVSFVLVVIMARYVSLLSRRPQITASQIAKMEELANRVAVSAQDATAAPKLAKHQDSDRTLVKWIGAAWLVAVLALVRRLYWHERALPLRGSSSRRRPPS